MSALITRVRKLINDTAGASQRFTDDETQDALDRFREDVRYLRLLPGETIATGGAVSYLNYYSPKGWGDWETDGVLQYSSTWATLTPATSDWLTGLWTFSSNQNPDVYLTGKTYDVYGAAAFLLREWAALEKLSFDGSGSGRSFSRKQKYEMLSDLASQYERRQRPKSVRMVRSDMRPDRSAF